MATSKGQAQLTHTRLWAVVIEGLDKSCTLDRLPLERTESGEQMWLRMRHHVYSSSITKRLWAWLSMFFVKVVVGTAVVNKAYAWSSAHSNPCLCVSYHKYKRDWFLTDVFHNPTLLLGNSIRTTNHNHLTIGALDSGRKFEGQRVIVIRKVLDKTRITWLLLVLLIMSPSLGLIIGYCTHKAEVGVAVSAGVFALASFIQGLAAWFQA